MYVHACVNMIPQPTKECSGLGIKRADLCLNILSRSNHLSTPHFSPSATWGWLYLSLLLQRDAEKINEITYMKSTLKSWEDKNCVQIQAIIITHRVCLYYLCLYSKSLVLSHLRSFLHVQFSETARWTSHSPTVPSPIVFSWQNFAIISVVLDFFKTPGKGSFFQFISAWVILVRWH